MHAHPTPCLHKVFSQTGGGGVTLRLALFHILFMRTKHCQSNISNVCIGNSMICSDIWRTYHEWYFEIWDSFEISQGIYAKYHVQIMLLFVYTSTHKRFVIFTCRYFKLSWNTTALSQSHCRNFSCSSISAN